MIEARIIELGRGPTIEGSRITVFDVLYYHQAGWYRDEIACLFRLSPTSAPYSMNPLVFQGRASFSVTISQ